MLRLSVHRACVRVVRGLSHTLRSISRRRAARRLHTVPLLATAIAGGERRIGNSRAQPAHANDAMLTRVFSVAADRSFSISKRDRLTSFCHMVHAKRRREVASSNHPHHTRSAQESSAKTAAAVSLRSAPWRCCDVRSGGPAWFGCPAPSLCCPLRRQRALTDHCAPAASRSRRLSLTVLAVCL